jgi:2-keto-4-pentenoate hydratase
MIFNKTNVPVRSSVVVQGTALVEGFAKGDQLALRQDVDALAQELLSAYEAGRMILMTPSARPGFDLDTAYEVEATLKRLREASGRRSVGRKVGYANKAVWRLTKLETRVWARLYDDTAHRTNNNSATLSFAHPSSLKIEPEIVFGLKQAITTENLATENLDATALESTDWLALGFEIIDCPFPQWQFQPGDFVASSGLHAASSGIRFQSSRN